MVQTQSNDHIRVAEGMSGQGRPHRDTSAVLCPADCFRVERSGWHDVPESPVDLWEPPPMSGFEMETSTEGDRAIVMLAGECDLTTRVGLSSVLLDAVARASDVVVDLAAVT